jgi:hypothetical protein
VPWFFALNHHKNAPPSILEEFQMHGLWVVQETHNCFSAIPIDQAHEQNIALVKGSDGAVGLTENLSYPFKKWMLAGPEQARLLTEFEAQYSPEVMRGFLHRELKFLLWAILFLKVLPNC